MVEEHVHELPQHVVGGLGELLARRTGRRSAARAPTRRRRARRRASGSRVAAPRTAASTAAAGRRRSRCRRARRAAPTCGSGRLADSAERRQRPLADDHRVHELDGDVARVGARRRRRAEREQPAAAREALRHRVAQLRQPLGLGREEALVGLDARGQQRVDAAGAVATAASRGAPARARGQRGEPARSSSTPSPVRALTSMRSTPGCTASRWCRKLVQVEVDVRRAGRSC